MSFKTFHFPTRFLLMLLFLGVTISSKAQVIYSHNFGTTTISSHPYTVAPTILNANLSNSSWTNSENLWTSTTGSTGQSIRVTSATNSTITLTFNVASNYKLDITSFNFWRARSNTGAANWAMTINGINAGSGTVPTTGAAIGNTNVSNPISGLTGTISVVISLTGNTGNGTFRLDDFTLNGNITLNCTASTVTSISPTTGPQNTLVTINGSGFQAGAGTSAVLFNGIASIFTVISDTKIEAYVPAGNATGNITITTNGCPGVATIPFTKIVSDVATNYSSDIYISEIHDVGTTADGGIGGSGGIIEIYNGTASTVNLSGYSVKRYGDIGDANPSITPLNLVGSIPAGGIFLLGLQSTTCPVTFDQTFNTGFNENDEFELLKNGVIIDNVHLVFTRSGFTLIRKPDAVAPKAVFNGNDWIDFDLERCANIGIHNVTVPPLPTVTNPVSKSVCESSTVSFSAPLSNPVGYTFQWKVLQSSGVWTNVTNGAQYSGATTNTLTINTVPSSFNDNQYYCQMTSSGKTIVSNAAQLEVSTSIIPDFNITPLSLCFGSTAPLLNTTSPNGIIGTWSPATISTTSPGSYVFTPNAGQCAVSVTLVVTINPKIIPDFNTTLNLCNGQSAPALMATSPNGITGTWSPATINNSTNGAYTFTPNAGQCAENVILNVVIGSLVTPNFTYQTTYCHGETVAILATTSPNGISGTWSPAIINNTADGIYTFTPNAGQCANNFILSVNVTPRTIPDFPPIPTICRGGSVPVLGATSPNGISGTWSPSVVSNTAGGSYTFTPNAGQCATNLVLNATVATQIIPSFAPIPTICSSSPAPILNTTSLNGITGTWNPPTVSNTAPGSYIFTPNAGQCAGNFTLNISVTNIVIPNFNYATSYCEGSSVPVLGSVSPNGISGTWSPAMINNTTPATYTFTPNAGQCATIQTLNVAIVPKVSPNFTYQTTYCHGETVAILATTSPNGISGTWSPSTINNTADGIYTFTPNAGQCANNFILSVNITPRTIPDFPPIPTICQGGSVPVLAATSPNGISGTWSPLVVSNTAGGSYTFTPNAGQCATNLVLNATVATQIIPSFAPIPTICSSSPAPILNTTSLNGITGTWNPPTVSNTAPGSYIFTPNAGQCAGIFTMNISVANSLTPNFSYATSYCEGSTVPVLGSVSPNGISGTWSPAIINNTTPGTYTFTPNASECATIQVLNVAIVPKVSPIFNYKTTYCNGDTADILGTTSLNGIVGTWSPATINNTADGTYTFTPNAGQCANNFVLSVNVISKIIPSFNYPTTYCLGANVPLLQTTSLNGISGTWIPSAISNTADGTYIFTPNSGQCAQIVSLNITINNGTLSPISGLGAVCENATVQLANSTANGTWSSNNTTVATVNSNGLVTGISSGSATITYSLSSGSCAVSVSKTITVNPLPKPVLSDKSICIDQFGTIISNGELNTGLPNNGTFSFYWTLDNAALSTTGNVHFADRAGTYEVIVTNLATGCFSIATAIVKVVPMATATATVAEDFGRNQTITINVTGGSGDFEYQLNHGLPQDSNQFTGVFSGEYEIIVRDKNGCKEIFLEVFALNYPRYFTPNGDGYHETWNIDDLEGQASAKIFIFDRYGKLIKFITPSTSGWNGTYNGQPLPATDYWFKLLYTGRDGSEKEFKSHFSLKR